MKILLLTAGTRGDVEPFAALARYASGRGYQVRLAAPDNSGVDMAGLDAVSLHVDFTQLISDQGVSPRTMATGHWACEAAAQYPDAELDDFMAGGDFVYAGFGSMKDPDGVRHGAAVIEAAQRNGLRALVTKGWGGLEVAGAAGDGVLVRKSVAHQQVLSRASLAVHHGGAGTVHAVARAGIPSVVVPFLADQPFWGRILHGRRLAPEPIPPRQLSLGRLTDAIAQAEECRDRAQKAGELIRREDGIAVSLGILEGLA